MTAQTPAFRTYSDKMSAGLIMVPRAMQYFSSNRFPKVVDATLYRRDRIRPADDWFWPSTHPGWTTRQLYYYLTEPERLEGRDWDFMGVLSVNVGTMVHELFKTAMVEEGILLKPEGTHCPSCSLPRKGRGLKGCNEWGVSDSVLKSRGHMDGVLFDSRFGTGGYDLKTTNLNTIAGLNDNDIEHFKKKWPYYYDQCQEYMRLSGLRFFIVHFVALGYPWTMKEVRVDYDIQRSLAIQRKYEIARESAEAGVPPMDCCTLLGYKEKDCPSRAICRSLR